MSGIDHLELTEITGTQSNKATASNDADHELVDIIAGTLDVEISTTTPVDILKATYLGACEINLVDHSTTPPTADFTVEFQERTAEGTPAEDRNRGIILVRNQTSYDATLKVESQVPTAVVLPAGQTNLYWLAHDELSIVIDVDAAGLDVLGLTSATAVDGAADWIPFWDTSAGILKRILPDNLGVGGGGGGGGESGSIEYVHTETFTTQSNVDVDLTVAPFELADDENLILDFSEITTSNDGVWLAVRVSNDNASTFETTNYNYQTSAEEGVNTSNVGGSTSAMLFVSGAGTWGLGNATGEVLSGQVRLSGLKDSAQYTMMTAHTAYKRPAGTLVNCTSAAQYTVAETITDVRVTVSAGTFSGKIHYYIQRVAEGDEPAIIRVDVGDETTSITTGTAKKTFRMPYAMTLSDVRASLTTASTSGDVTVDINEGGTSVLSTKLTIDQDEKTSETAATAAVISDTALADDAEITIDIDGAGTGAAGLKVTLIGTQA